MRTFKSGYLEAMLQLMIFFDKAVVKTGTTSTVGNVAFLWNFLRGEVVCKYKLPL